MCDTMVALGNSTKDGTVIFAKNSDRQPNEPHIIVRIPRQKYNIEEEKLLKATYIKIPQVQETYEVVLLKPSWIWGCEMGWNEFGLNIGNEAVFTKEKYGSESLTGMDMVRIALERCKSSEEAVDTITELLAQYGQGGNCGYGKAFTYHNSFLIADKESAYVLETAGQYWAAKKVEDIYCISNCLSIGKDFDRCHPELISHAIQKGWCKNEKDFNFAECYSDRLFTHFSGSKIRRAASEGVLRQDKGNISVDTMKRILRTHEDKIEGRQFRKNSVRSVCMHGGGPIGDHTTGSYIASIGKKLCTYWVTGASTPCISVFKPLWMSDKMPVFKQEEEKGAIAYWTMREKLHRMILHGHVDMEAYYLERERIESEYSCMLEGLDSDNMDSDALARMSAEAFGAEEEFVNRMINLYEAPLKRMKGKGSYYYKRYWQNMSKKLFDL